VSHAADESRPIPRRAWYLAAIVPALVGLAGAWLFFWPRLASVDDGVIRMVVPGKIAMALQPGSYTVFHEYRAVVGGRYYETPEVSGLRVVVTTAQGTPVELGGAAETRYTLPGHSGVSLLTFDIDTPGSYILSAGYADKNGPETVLAVGQGFIRRLFGLIGGTIAIAFAGLGSTIAIASVTYVKRRRAREAKP
jgi:hypothetical protein